MAVILLIIIIGILLIFLSGKIIAGLAEGTGAIVALLAYIAKGVISLIQKIIPKYSITGGLQMKVLFGFIAAILASEAAQAFIILGLLALIGWAGKRWAWTRHIVALGIEAYEYAEAEGVLKGLKAYQKFDPFMNRFITQYRAKHGKDPAPKDKAKAVEAMEKQVTAEHLGK